MALKVIILANGSQKHHIKTKTLSAIIE